MSPSVELAEMVRFRPDISRSLRLLLRLPLTLAARLERNTNGLLRDYFPKGTDLSTHSTQHLLAVENELNHRPRLILNGRAPAELFGALLTSHNRSMLRR